MPPTATSMPSSSSLSASAMYGVSQSSGSGPDAMRQANSEIATVSAVTSTASSRSNLSESLRINAGLERYGLWLVCRSWGKD